MPKRHMFSSMGYYHTPLTEGEIADLCCSIKIGIKADKGSSIYQEAITSRNRMIVANLSLVISWIKMHPQNGNHDFQDMVQEGCLGIIEAAQRFDPSFGSTFSTYATFWIKQAILKFVKEDAVFSVKQSAWCARALLDRARERLEKLRLPTDPESVRKAAGMSVKRAATALKCAQKTVCDTDIRDENFRNENNDYMGIRQRTTTTSHESDIEDRDFAEHRSWIVASALQRIDPGQAYVLMRRFGIGCKRGLQREISGEIGWGKDTVGRMERDGIESMIGVIGGTVI